MRTTYIFGAGASAASDFALPCMEGFFNQDFISEKYPSLSTFIDQYFKGVPLAKLNLEDVITSLDLAEDDFGRFGNVVDPDFIKARYEFFNYVRFRLDYKPLHGRKWCQKHLVLLNKVNSSDTLITLNYDLILENTILEKDRSQGTSEEDRLLDRLNQLLQSAVQHIGGPSPILPGDWRDKGFLLKLHGSVNWLYCPRKGCPHNQAFYTTFQQNEIKDLALNRLCYACGEKLEPVIVPPTMNKVFERFPKMGFIWSLAFREIQTSSRLVFIGLSFAESDYYFRWLLRSSLKNGIRKENIYVVNQEDKKEDIVAKMRYLLGVDVVAANYVSSFEDLNNKINTGSPVKQR